jgi:outer membrane protein OmpA-like peptidoglycan-associated protein
VIRAALVGTLALLAGCGGQAPAPEPSPAAPAAPVSRTAAPTSPSIGNSSALTASTSALKGEVSDFQVERTTTETRVLLAADTLFAFDKADLSAAAEANLVRTAEVVAAGGAGVVTVAGHTDAKGEDAYNLDLSRRRAEAVANWLKARSELGGRDIQAVGRGESEPVAPNAAPDGSDDPAGRARNRRVVVIVPAA